MTWTKLNTNNSYTLNNIYFLNQDTGYAVGGERFEIGIILQTTDGGQTWSNKPIGKKAFYAMDFLNNQKGMIVGFDGFIYKTFDAGNSWMENHSDSEWGKVYHCIHFISDSVGFIAGGIGYDDGFILKTTNSGISWIQTDSTRELRSIIFTSERTGFASGYGIIYKTTDSGQTWNPTDAKGDFFVAMAFPSANVGYAVGYEGTIIKTTDGGDSWKKLRNGNNVLLKNMQFESVDFIDENTGYVVGRKGVMIKTDNGGDDWKIVKNTASENLKSIFLISSSSGFVATESGNIYQFVE